MRFIILSAPRSGTHLLRTSIMQHPDVEVKGHEPTKKFAKRESKDYYSEQLEKLFESQKEACGFAVLISDIWKNENLCLALKESLQSGCIISLHRRNRVRQAVSFYEARERGWVQEIGGINLSKDPFNIRVDILHSILARNDLWRDAQKKFEDDCLADQLNLTYETLWIALNRQAKRVWEKLNVGPFEVTPLLRQQGTVALCDLLLNYDEVFASLWDTKYQECL